MSRYDDALQELYQAPLAQFVAERKRLASTLRAAGDRAEATALLARRRPSLSAWVVNQLYWHARDAFDAMLATAARLRAGDVSAQPAHRDALADLRARAARFLGDAGHPASEPTLRRVISTLSALAAIGGFAPDPAGALVEDRDAPGFEAAGLIVESGAPSSESHPEPMRDDGLARRRAEEQQKRRREQHDHLEAALRTARGEVHTRERVVREAEQQLERAQRELDEARSAVRELEQRIEPPG
jgi:hypothetical protein